MKLSFHGATRGVTGSCHLLICNNKRILIDCGLYQGGREIEEDNHGDFGFEPAGIDYLLLTHAHLDHCGRIPLLVKRGFQGEIITTSASYDLAKLVMLDSAHLQEEDAERSARRAQRRRGNNHLQDNHLQNNHQKEQDNNKPLYTTLDALDCLDYFGRKARYDEEITICDGIKVTFINAGHILGSASVLLELTEKTVSKKLLFSGDLGYHDRAILGDPATPPEADFVVMETTYGNRQHKALQPSVEELYEAINDSFRRGGNVIIPSFALERSQEILYYLREGVEQGLLPVSMQVFLDSPMAISATEIFKRHPECYDDATCKLFRSGNDPFGFSGLHFTRETSQSMALNQFKGGAVIIAGSGMCTGGRVRHHLKHNLWRKDSSVIFVGYAANGTLARRILDGADTVRIFGEEIRVNAKIYTIGGFSAHADQQELLSWHKATGKPQKTFLVHGEETVMQVFAQQLSDTGVYMPEQHESFEL